MYWTSALPLEGRVWEPEDLGPHSASTTNFPSVLRLATNVPQASVSSHAKWGKNKSSLMHLITITMMLSL